MAYLGRRGATAALTTGDIPDNSITAAKIVVDTIAAGDIAPNAITPSELADNAVTTSKIVADAVDGTKLADNAVNSEHYTDGSIDLAHMSVNSIDSDQYVDASIDTAHIGDDQVTADKLANSINTDIATGVAALPKSGGTMSGNIVMADDTSIGIADDAERIEFDGAGDIAFLGCNVGIGESAPAHPLRIVQQANATPAISIRSTVSDPTASINFTTNEGTVDWYIGKNVVGANAGDIFSIGTSGTATGALAITAAGDVGIGTSDATDSAWGVAGANKALAIDGTTGYANIHLRGLGGGATDTRFSMGVGDSKFYLAYDDVAGVHRIQVESNGAVLMPSQPAFRAYLSANQTSNNSWAAVSLNSTSFNIGNHFNTSTGVFTAPVAGRYFLNGTVMFNTACSYLYVSLYINGGTMPYLEGRNTGTYGTDMTLSGSLVADLAANDSITLYCYNNTANYIIGGTVLRSSMSGYLIG